MAALAQLNQLAGSVGAAERLTATGGLHCQSWYPQAQGFGPVIGGPGAYTGPGLGSGAFPGNGAGPSGLHSHVSRLCQVISISSSCFEQSVFFLLFLNYVITYISVIKAAKLKALCENAVIKNDFSE